MMMKKFLMLVTVLFMGACGDVFFAEPAAREGAAISFSYAMAASDGAAFDKANRVNIFVSMPRTDTPASDEALLLIDTTVALSPSGDTRVHIPIGVPDGTYQGIAGIAVMRGSDTLFTKFQEVSMQIREGETNPLVFDSLRPYITSITMPASVRTLTGPGDTVTVVAVPLYASGDVATGARCSYFIPSQSGNVVTVNSQTGRVVAVAPGTATIAYTCQFSPALASVNVTVASPPPPPPPPATASLSGTVVNASTNAPVAGATVTLTPAGGQSRLATTTSTGGYSFTDLPTGQHAAAVTATGFSSLTTSLTLVSGPQTHVFALTPTPASDPCQTHATLQVGTTTDGTLSSSDCQIEGVPHDLFDLTLADHQSIGMTITAGSEAVFVSIGDIYSQFVAAGASIQLPMILPPGTYHLSVGGSPGTYSLALGVISDESTSCTVFREWPIITHGTVTEQDGPLCPDPGDVYYDVFRMLLTAGQSYTYTVTASTPKYMEMWSPGVFLARGQPGTTATFTFTPSSTGVYELNVFAGDANSRGPYTLTVH